MTTDTKATETRTFEADVSRPLHMMVHSVYSDRDLFLRELISNAADACEKLRYESIRGQRLLVALTQCATQKRSSPLCGGLLLTCLPRNPVTIRANP